MAHVVFYAKPGCGGNARQQSLLQAAGHTLTVRDLLAEPWTAATLLQFLAPLPVAEWFNRASPRLKRGEVVPEGMDAAAALALLLADHLLIRRPLLQVGGDRRVGFDPGAIAAWIGLEGATDKEVGEGCPKGGAHRPCPPPGA
ncbi:MAG TPA: ArsC/Spx/MgsR family protein [Azospira sp.]|nr:ArsC/Spx/MgsR family protein [Azospira sp.]